MFEPIHVVLPPMASQLVFEVTQNALDQVELWVQASSQCPVCGWKQKVQRRANQPCMHPKAHPSSGHV